MSKNKVNWNVLLGAAFLMATSAIGPGFLTQSTTFTGQLGASFGFVILISIIFDIGAQLNIWRIIVVSKKRGQEIANMVIPGLGYIIAILVVLGGLAFNIGNIGGAGLGLNVLFGIDSRMGALISAGIAIGIFLIKEAGKAMDKFAQVMGFIMILVTLYVVGVSHPPLRSAVAKSFVPENINMMAIITLVGGTVGGYITFAGGHRLLDAGVKGKENIARMNKSCFTGIGIASLMRIFLFLATLGVISQGFILDPLNPPASVFKFAAGKLGYKILAMLMNSVDNIAYNNGTLEKEFHYFTI